MPGGGCRGGIPGLGPCMTAGPGRVITGAPGEPSWLSLPVSEGVPFSLLESMLESSGRFTLPGEKDKIRFYDPLREMKYCGSTKKKRDETRAKV